MQSVRSGDTSPELALRRALYALGIRGWRCHRRDIPGKPDLSFGRARLAVFVDGGFWHGHPNRHWPGRIGPYWDAKIARNQARDVRVGEVLQGQGWTVLRLWDFDVLADPQVAAQKVMGLMLRRGGLGASAS
jgi:DNA mismatch endonuclease (patch repair protein)